MISLMGPGDEVFSMPLDQKDRQATFEAPAGEPLEVWVKFDGSGYENLKYGYHVPFDLFLTIEDGSTEKVLTCDQSTSSFQRTEFRNPIYVHFGGCDQPAGKGRPLTIRARRQRRQDAPAAYVVENVSLRLSKP